MEHPGARADMGRMWGDIAGEMPLRVLEGLNLWKGTGEYGRLKARE